VFSATATGCGAVVVTVREGNFKVVVSNVSVVDDADFAGRFDVPLLGCFAEFCDSRSVVASFRSGVSTGCWMESGNVAWLKLSAGARGVVAGLAGSFSSCCESTAEGLAGWDGVPKIDRNRALVRVGAAAVGAVETVGACTGVPSIDRIMASAITFDVSLFETTGSNGTGAGVIEPASTLIRFANFAFAARTGESAGSIPIKLSGSCAVAASAFTHRSSAGQCPKTL